MIIQKIFNNNACMVEDENKNEIILMGKGIAFQKKQGDKVDETKIQKRFVFDTTELNQKFSQLFDEVPVKYLELTDSIVDMVQNELQVKLDPNIYIALTDHISYAVNRYEKEEKLRNVLLWEIKKFYPKEFKLAMKALDIIEYETHVQLDEDEAGYIAMHFVNAQHDGEEMNQTIAVTKIVEDILQIVEFHYQFKLDEDSMNYMRFVTHIRYFARRLFSNDIAQTQDEMLFEQIKNRYPESYKCTVKVKRYIEELYHISISREEMVYFMLHINRVCNRVISQSS